MTADATLGTERSRDIVWFPRPPDDCGDGVASLRQTGDSKHMGESHLVVPTRLLPRPPSPAGPWAYFSRPALTPVASATASTSDQ
jgi:hypothetical protein